MANSMIEDMFAETNQYNDYKELKKNKNKNGRGKKVILFFVLLIILVALGIAVFLFIKSTQKTSVSVKNEFISYLEQGNFIDMNMSAIEEVFEKLANNSSTLKSNITISTNVTELEELANYTAEINTDYDAKKHRGLIDINLDYLNNAIFDMQALITGEKIALKSDEIVTKYVGYKYENLLSSLSTYDNDYINSLEPMIGAVKKFDYETLFSAFTPEFLQSELVKYVQVLNTVDESKFSKKEVTLKREMTTVDATAYVLNLNETELLTFVSEMLKELQNDTELISIILDACEPMELGIDETMLKELIDMLINYTYTLEGNAEENYTFSFYVSESKVIRMSLENSNMCCDVDYISDSNNNKYIVTILENENNDGIKLEINRVSNDISEEIRLILNIIEGNEVTSKISTEVLFEGITSKKQMTIDANFTYADTENELNVNIQTDAEFADSTVEDLTVDNCLFLDELSEEERTLVIESIETRAAEIFSDKQNQINLIKSNTGSSVIEGQTPSVDDETQKAMVQEKLIVAVANEMIDAQSEGEEYTVHDLADLQVEGSEVQVTVENDIATVIIDGYTFSINAAFELSE